jgi:hypothetical protein
MLRFIWPFRLVKSSLLNRVNAGTWAAHGFVRGLSGRISSRGRFRMLYVTSEGVEQIYSLVVFHVTSEGMRHIYSPAMLYATSEGMRHIYSPVVLLATSEGMKHITTCGALCNLGKHRAKEKEILFYAYQKTGSQGWRDSQYSSGSAYCCLAYTRHNWECSIPVARSLTRRAYPAVYRAVANLRGTQSRFQFVYGQHAGIPAKNFA